jgi:hypothetical protein
MSKAAARAGETVVRDSRILGFTVVSMTEAAPPEKKFA